MIRWPGAIMTVFTFSFLPVYRLLSLSAPGSRTKGDVPVAIVPYIFTISPATTQQTNAFFIVIQYRGPLPVFKMSFLQCCPV